MKMWVWRNGLIAVMSHSKSSAVVLAIGTTLFCPAVFSSTSRIITSHFADPTVLPWESGDLSLINGHVPVGTSVDVRAQILPSNNGPGWACPCDLRVGANDKSGLTVEPLSGDTFKLSGEARESGEIIGGSYAPAIPELEAYATFGGTLRLMDKGTCPPSNRCGLIYISATSKNIFAATTVTAAVTSAAYDVHWIYVPPSQATLTVNLANSTEVGTMEPFGLCVKNEEIFAPPCLETHQTSGGTLRSFESGPTLIAPTQHVFSAGVNGPAGQTINYSLSVSFSPATRSVDLVAPLGTTALQMATIFIEAPAAAKTGTLDTTFTAVTDKPYITVTPASGTLPAAGLSLAVAIDPTMIPVGTNTGTVVVSGPANSPIASVPTSLTLATPIASGGRSSPPPNTLIIPAVAHAAGANNSQFQSDIRMTNLSASTTQYQLTFTPSTTDGTTQGQKTNFNVVAGRTVALNDVLFFLFGNNAAGQSSSGALEIRPLNSTKFDTVASSRLYSTSADGTFGQFIPAVTVQSLIGKSDDPSKPQVISLQQISQSALTRTNLGLIEGTGQAATVVVRVFDTAGVRKGEFTYDLKPAEHRQMNAYLAANDISLTDGRFEVSVVGGTGRVSAYASVVDTGTTDPFLVSPAFPATISSTKYIVPGVADLSGGAANFRTDMRIYNAGTDAVTATMTYVPQGAPTNTTVRTVNIDAGEVKALDNVLFSTFGLSGTGGAVQITTPVASRLVATAKTFSVVAKGTNGQFIPGVTPTEGIGTGDRGLELLQLEESAGFRTNIGLVETTGNAVTVQLTASLPDTLASPVLTYELRPNEFLQIGRALKQFSSGNTYNGRVTIKVIAGSGKVSAYASVIDNRTQDPTYVPAQ